MVHFALKDLFIGPNAYRTYWYAFLIAFPFSWRNVIIPSISGGPFNEFMDFSVYIGDILILSSFISILRHKKVYESILVWISRFHVEQVMLLLLAAYLTTSLLSGSSAVLLMDSIWGYARIMLVAIVFYFVIIDQSSDSSTWNTLFFSIGTLATGLLAQSFIGISQFILNGSLGIRVLGESILATRIPGVAEINLGGSMQIRAYGTFLHPNVFGGYIVVVLLVLIRFFQMFHVEQSLLSIKLFHVKQLVTVILVILPITALILSFSKSAIFALVMAAAVYLFHVERNIIRKKFHVERMVLIVGLLAMFIVATLQGMDGIGQSLSERLDQYLSARSGFINNQWVGYGPGNSVMAQTSFGYYERWMLQPVHNVYLLLLFEFGYLGFSLLIALLLISAKKVPRGTSVCYWLPIISLGIIGVFDHYLLTLYVGNILLGIALGWLFAGSSIDKKYNKLQSI